MVPVVVIRVILIVHLLVDVVVFTKMVPHALHVPPLLEESVYIALTKQAYALVFIVMAVKGIVREEYGCMCTGTQTVMLQTGVKKGVVV